MAMPPLPQVAHLAAIVVLSPLLALGFVTIGIGAALVLAVERLAGGRPGPAQPQPAYNPQFERFGQRPAI